MLFTRFDVFILTFLSKYRRKIIFCCSRCTVVKHNFLNHCNIPLCLCSFNVLKSGSKPETDTQRICLGLPWKKIASNRYLCTDRSNFFAIAAAVNCKHSSHTVCTAGKSAFVVADNQQTIIHRISPCAVSHYIPFTATFLFQILNSFNFGCSGFSSRLALAVRCI